MVTIDGTDYPIDYVRKALLLYSDFKSGELENSIKEAMKNE